MSLLKDINPFKQKDVDCDESGKEKIKQDSKDRPVNPHETGGCCGGCGGLQETDE